MANNNSSILISQIFKSRTVILDIFEHYQTYDTSEYNHFSINEVNSMYIHNQLDMLLEKTEEGKKKKIYISYYLSKTIKPANILEMIDDLYNLEEMLTTNDTIFIIIQSIKHLQFNILENILVPKHRVLTNLELEEVRLKYNITDDAQFPDISRFDPVAKVIGIYPGQVCEIIRPSKTAIEGKYYRICI